MSIQQNTSNTVEVYASFYLNPDVPEVTVDVTLALPLEEADQADKKVAEALAKAGLPTNLLPAE